MNIKQKGKGAYYAFKYSELSAGKHGYGITSTSSNAEHATANLIKFGYAIMDGYQINEIMKVIRSLRELGYEYTMKTIEGAESLVAGNKFKGMYYEFTTVFFEDDRRLPTELQSVTSKALVNELRERYNKTEVKKDEDKRAFQLICPSGERGFVSYDGQSKRKLSPHETVIIHK